MSKPPAFQFYPKDWLASTLGLPWDVAGLHIHLIAYSWENGPLPDDPKWRQRVIGTDPKAGRLWAAVTKRWKKTAAGWINPRLERQREIQATFRARGEKGAAARWEEHPSMAQADAKPMLERRPQASRKHMQKRWPASSSASSSSDQDQPAAARPVSARTFKRIVATASRLLAEDETLALDPGRFAEDLKRACAKQDLRYEATSIQKAMDAATVAHARKRA